MFYKYKIEKFFLLLKEEKRRNKIRKLARSLAFSNLSRL